MKRNRPDLGTFAPGNVYRHSATGELVEFVGVAFAAPLPDGDDSDGSDGEDVAVFRPVGTPGAPLTADRAGYDRGETFELVRDLDRAALEVADPSSDPLETGRVDRNDIFGVRRALDALQEPHRQSFLHRWSIIGDQCEYDVNLIRTAVVREARATRRRDPDLAAAWTTVSSAMAAYLAWRSARPERRSS
jgi:hypothetical protein